MASTTFLMYGLEVPRLWHLGLPAQLPEMGILGLDVQPLLPLLEGMLLCRHAVVK
jgi:hypothetical protein